MSFTYYGDLVGISSAYRLSPQAAHQKLDLFYNLSYRHLHHLCGGARNKILMFSDSIFLYGDETIPALTALRELYAALLSESLFLRGAVVDGRLEFEARLATENFEKQLPVNDVLVRATGLANSVKGARLIIERELAHQLLPSVSWHTLDGYLTRRNDHPEIAKEDFRRYISPIPEGTLYEILYFYPTTDHDLDKVGTLTLLKQ